MLGKNYAFPTLHVRQARTAGAHLKIALGVAWNQELRDDEPPDPACGIGRPYLAVERHPAAEKKISAPDLGYDLL